MTPKEYLSQFLAADRAINYKMEHIAQLRSLAAKVTQTFTDGDHGVHDDDRLAKVIAKIVDMEREVDADIDRLQEVKAEVSGAISRVSDSRYRDLLELRYINGNTLFDVSEAMSYSYKYARALHAEALKHVDI